MPTRLVVRHLTAAALSLGLATTTVLALPAMAGAQDYTVSEGETLSHVAVRTNLSVAELRELNDLDDVDRIFAGQSLRVSSPTRTYTVKSGDTLSQIAIDFATTTNDLLALNSLGNDDHIRAGQVLQIPASAMSSAAAATIDAGNYPNLPDRILDRPERLALIPTFERWAAANDLPVDLLMATAWHESGWNQEAMSSVGAAGVGQIMPITGEWVAAHLIGQPDLDRFDAEDNIRISARYLDWLLDRNDGDVRLALGSYFQGPTSVGRGEWLDVTERYTANVIAQRALFTNSVG